MHLHSIIIFAAIVVVLLILDLYFVGRKAHAISTREAGIWSFIFVAVSLVFAWYVYVDEGSQKATEFLTAYVIEKTLSVDNLFVFILVFSFFKVPKEYHHKVLFWGVLGAIVLRAIFIFAGVQLIELTYITLLGLKVNIVLTLFGAFLIYAGIKTGIEALGKGDDEDEDYSKSPGAKFVKWLFPRVTENYEGDKFFVKKSVQTRTGEKLIKFATPLLVVVGVVEFTDLLFAVDSIPAIFSVSTDPFILYSSNIFAILGLRSMYFLLANLLPLFRFLGHGLAIILAFIGVKMVIAPFYHVDPTFSLVLVLGILGTSVLLSLAFKEKVES